MPGGVMTGSGTSGDPYLVTDADDLNAVRNNLSAYYKQTVNIDLNIAPYNEGEGWVPIGTFTGNYDGDNKIISNLYINKISSQQNGLFSIVTGALSNISLTNVLININGNAIVGSLVGQIDGTIQNCHATGSVSGGIKTGGLIGETGGGFTFSPSIFQCSTNMNVSSYYTHNDFMFIGGLIGFHRFKIISECWSIGNVIATNANQNTIVGGLAGQSEWFIDTSYSTANVTGNYFVGGLIGGSWFDTTDTFFYKCFARGNVVVARTSDGGNAAGLIGYRHHNHGVNQCYSTGHVSSSGGFTSELSGLVGNNINTLRVINSVYDSQTSGQSDNDGRGTPKTTAEMKNINTYLALGWSF